MLEDILKVNSAGHFHDLEQVRTHRPDPMDYLLVWVVRGGFQMRLGSKGGRTYAGAPGDLFVMPPGVTQDYRAGPPAGWEWLWVHFEGSAAKRFAQAIGAHAPGPPGPPGSPDRHQVHLGLDDRVRDRFLELVVAAPYPARDWREATGAVVADTCLYSLLGLILDRLGRRARAGQDEPAVDVSALQRYVHEHLAERLTVERLAAEANLSPAHYTRLVKAMLGVPPMQYVIRKRMDRAATLLEQTPMKLAAIAAAVGYQDPYYFSRLFKRVTGVAPSAYRRGEKGRG